MEELNQVIQMIRKSMILNVVSVQMVKHILQIVMHVYYVQYPLLVQLVTDCVELLASLRMVIIRTQIVQHVFLLLLNPLKLDKEDVV